MGGVSGEERSAFAIRGRGALVDAVGTDNLDLVVVFREWLGPREEGFEFSVDVRHHFVPRQVILLGVRHPPKSAGVDLAD